MFFSGSGGLNGDINFSAPFNYIWKMNVYNSYNAGNLLINDFIKNMHSSQKSIVI